jgi:hypothetical protein
MATLTVPLKNGLDVPEVTGIRERRRRGERGGKRQTTSSAHLAPSTWKFTDYRRFLGPTAVLWGIAAPLLATSSEHDSCEFDQPRLPAARYLHYN